MWRKSSFSEGPTTDCVEVELTGSGAAVRDSKHTGSELRFPAQSWKRFTTLNLDDDVLSAARVAAAAEGVSLGAVVARVAVGHDGLPTFVVPPDAPALTPDMVRRAS